MSEEQDQKIKERLHSIFPDEKVANRMIDIVTAKRPVGWSRKSYAPYYKEVYALQIREPIDDMIRTKNDIIYRYEIWCTHETAMSTQTLYFRINQSIRYLCDFLDPDGIYKQWREMISIRRKRNHGIVISYIPEFKYNISQLKPELVLPREAMPAWRKRMEDWLEGDEISPFVQEQIALTSDDIAWIKQSLSEVGGIKFNVTSSSIKIVRYNEQ